jgi:ADP-ribosylglycohydrolase
MIMEEKKRCVPSKTDNSMLRCSPTFKSKRLNSLSNVSPMPQPAQLPRRITQILSPTNRYPNIFHIERRETELDSVYGAFFGFLIGDMVGSHMAYITHDIETYIPNSLLMNGGGTYNLGPGQGTDQTEILLSLCEGLIEGNGAYSRNLIASKYMEWFESRPFNFSAVFALAMKELRMRKIEKVEIDPGKVGDILMQSSLINKNQESSIGLIRVLPLTLFSLRFKEEDFEALVRGKVLTM